jgi:hypothetical protein
MNQVRSLVHPFHDVNHCYCLLAALFLVYQEIPISFPYPSDMVVLDRLVAMLGAHILHWRQKSDVSILLVPPKKLDFLWLSLLNLISVLLEKLLLIKVFLLPKIKNLL